MQVTRAFSRLGGAPRPARLVAACALLVSLGCKDNPAKPAAGPDVSPGITVMLLGTTPERARVQWTAPTTGVPAVAYNLYRQIDGGLLEKINSEPLAATSYTDSTLGGSRVCYEVAGLDAEAREGTHSLAACVDWRMPDFALFDLNPNSPTSGEQVSPRQFLGEISAWYFGHST